MARHRNHNRKNPNKTFRCKICNKKQSGKQFYKSHKTINCVTCLRKKRRKQGGNHLSDITINSTKGDFMYKFKCVILQLANNKGLHWRTLEKWFSCHLILRFNKYIQDQLKEQKLQMGDYRKTWKLGFKQTEGLTLREQFKYRNLLVVSIKQ